MAKKQSYDNESITMLKGPDKVRNAPVSFLALTDWTAVPIRFLKSFPTLSMKHVPDTAARSS